MSTERIYNIRGRKIKRLRWVVRVLGACGLWSAGSAGCGGVGFKKRGVRGSNPRIPSYNYEERFPFHWTPLKGHFLDKIRFSVVWL